MKKRRWLGRSMSILLTLLLTFTSVGSNAAFAADTTSTGAEYAAAQEAESAAEETEEETAGAEETEEETAGAEETEEETAVAEEADEVADEEDTAEEGAAPDDTEATEKAAAADDTEATEEATTTDEAKAADTEDDEDAEIPDDAVYFNGHYYMLYALDSITSWSQAAAYCESVGGYLATITSAAEDAFLYKYIRSLDYYHAFFGLSDAESEGTWVWITGETVSYANWADGEPNAENDEEDYAEYSDSYTDGTWNDARFDEYSGSWEFLCEWGEITESETETEITQEELDAADTLTVGEEATAFIEEEGEYAYFAFTPSESGYYQFYSTGEYDTFAYLYDTDLNLLASDDDDGTDYNALITYELEEGVTCYIVFGFLDSSVTGSFSVYAETCTYVYTVSAEVILTQDLTLTQGENSWTEYDDDGESFDYYEVSYDDFSSGDQIILTMSDASTVTYTSNGSDFWDSDGNMLYFSCEAGTDQYTEHWEVGGTYSVTLTFFYNEYVTTEISVTIAANPYKGGTAVLTMSADSLEYIEGVDYCWLNYDSDNEEYYYYYQYAASKFTEGDQIVITSADGESSVTYTYYGYSFYDEDWNELSYSAGSTQETEHWEVGGTYYYTLTLSNYPLTVEVPVTIVENPYEGATAVLTMSEDYTVYYQGIDSETYYDDDGDAYDYYYFSEYKFTEGDQIVITSADGESSVTYTYDDDYDWFYDEDWNWLSYSVSSAQETEHWEVGGTYYFILSLDNYVTTVEVPVTIDVMPYMEYNGHYYYLYPLSYADTWDDAVSYCESVGGYLAAVTTAEENAAIAEYNSQSYYHIYIGFTDEDEEGTWVWVNGEDTDYTNWNDGEPNDEDSYENYAYMYQNGTWNDACYAENGGYSEAFLCEWDSVSDVPGEILGLSDDSDDDDDPDDDEESGDDNDDDEESGDDEEPDDDSDDGEDPDDDEDHTHTYTSEITKEATCTEDGVITYTCTECGDTYTEIILATDHDYEAVVTEPTCTEGGYTTYTCSVCGESYIDDYTEATGHDYEEVVTEPTCTEKGYTTYTCSVCGDSYIDDYVDANGHDWDGNVCTECDAVKSSTITSSAVELEYTSETYTGSALKPDVTVTINDTELEEGTDYSLLYSNNTSAGTAAVTVTGKGSYSGTVKKNFTINAKSISSATVKLSKSGYTYDGNTKKPTVTVKVSGKTLKKGTDYEVTYSNNKNAGTAKVKITGTGNYKGSCNKSFTIKKASQSLTIKTSAKTVKYSRVKKTKQTVKAITKVSGAKGTVTYTKTSGKSYFTVNKSTGKITVKKGTKKGTYTIKIKVKSAATTNYKSATKTVKVKITVK